MNPAAAKISGFSRALAAGLLALVLDLGGALPAAGEKNEPPAEPQVVLSSPVEGMGKNRQIMPLPKMQIDPATASPDATPAERPDTFCRGAGIILKVGG
jgi:hypothetical protein